METFEQFIDRITPKELRYRLKSVLDQGKDQIVTVCYDCDRDNQLHELYWSKNIRVSSGVCRMHCAKALLDMGMSTDEVVEAIQTNL